MDQRKDEGVSIIGLNYRRGSQVYGTPAARVTPSPHDMYRSLSAQGLRLRLATCDLRLRGWDSSGEFFVLTLEFIIRFLFWVLLSMFAWDVTCLIPIEYPREDRARGEYTPFIARTSFYIWRGATHFLPFSEREMELGNGPQKRLVKISGSRRVQAWCLNWRGSAGIFFREEGFAFPSLYKIIARLLVIWSVMVLVCISGSSYKTLVACTDAVEINYR